MADLLVFSTTNKLAIGKYFLDDGPRKKFGSVALSGAQPAVTLWTPGTGKSIGLRRIIFTISAAANVSFFWGSDADGTRFALNFPAANGADFEFDYGEFILPLDIPLKLTTDAGDMKLNVIGQEE